MTLDEAIREFEFDCKIRHLSPKTILVLSNRCSICYLNDIVKDDNEKWKWNTSKQCNSGRIAKSLLDGSALKPLKTRAYALWLRGISALSPAAAFAEIKKTPLAPVVGI